MVKAELSQHLARLWRYGLVLSRQRHVAEDLVQATCVRALERAGQFVPGTHMDRWLLRILHSIWLNEVRARRVRQGAGQVDADGQHNFKEIPLLLQPLINGSSDIAIGTRFKRDEDIKQIPKARKIILKTAIIINGLFTGIWLSDAHNGFRALNNNALSKIKLKENRMAHASEILSQIKMGKLRYEEVPVNIVYTDYSKMKGQSSINSINIFIDLILKNFF